MKVTFRNWWLKAVLILVAAIIAVAVGVAVGVAAWGFVNQESLSQRKLLSEGSRTIGTVIEKKILQERESLAAYQVSYTFSPDNEEQVTRHRVNMEKQVWDALYVGSPIEIAFDRANPSRNLPVAGAEKTPLEIVAFIAAVTSALGSFAILSFLFRWVRAQIARLTNKPNYFMRK